LLNIKLKNLVQNDKKKIEKFYLSLVGLYKKRDFEIMKMTQTLMRGRDSWKTYLQKLGT